MSDSKFCINCQIIEIKSHLKYCSKQCQMDYQHKERVKKWLAGEVDGTKGKSEVADYVKRHVIDIRGHRCERCKNETWNEEKILLSLHHIDGNFRNNTLNNLQLLCHNCHAQTPNYGNKNKGFGRPRYEKYMEG